MGLYRRAIDKYMSSFNLNLDFLPEKKIVRDYGTIFCNVVNMYNRGEFVKEFRICNRKRNDGEWEAMGGQENNLIEPLKKTPLVYLGADSVANEFVEMSKEYSQDLIDKGHFDD